MASAIFFTPMENFTADKIRNIGIIAQVDVAPLPHNLSVLSHFRHRETPVFPDTLPVNVREIKLKHGKFYSG